MNLDDAATVVRKLRVMAAVALSHAGRPIRSRRDAELLLRAARLLARPPLPVRCEQCGALVSPTFADDAYGPPHDAEGCDA